MALKRTVASLEEVAESFRSLYTKQADGSFALEVEGDENVGGLKKALESERTARSTYERELKDLRKTIEGLDPDAARAAMAKLQQIEEKKLLDAGEVDKVIAQRHAALVADHNNQLTGFKTQVLERDTKLQQLNDQLRKLTLHGTIQSMAAKKGLRPEAVNDAIARLTILGVGGGADGKPGVRWDLRDGEVVALRGDEIAYGKDPSRPMTWDEGFALLNEEAKHLFAPSSGGGSGEGAARMNGRDVVLTRDEARDVQRYRAAQEQAGKAGGTVIVQQEAGA